MAKDTLEKIKKMLTDKLDWNIKSVSIKEIINENEENIARSKKYTNYKTCVCSIVGVSVFGLICVLKPEMVVNMFQALSIVHP